MISPIQLLRERLADVESLSSRAQANIVELTASLAAWDISAKALRAAIATLEQQAP